MSMPPPDTIPNNTTTNLFSTNDMLARRIKPIETCDNCKNRKVKCNKEKPICGTCNKTKRVCTYNFSASSKRPRPKSELEILQEQVEDIQSIQYQQLNQMNALLEIATTTDANINGDFNTSDTLIPGENVALQVENDYLAGNGVLDWSGFYPPLDVESIQFLPSLNQNLSEETLQFTSQFAASIQKDEQGIPINDSDNYNNTKFGHADQTSIEELTNQLKSSLKIYESTRYVGTGSLLMLNETGEEQMIPQPQDDLSVIEPYLKIMPNPKTAESLIDVYYQKIYRHYPHLKRKVVLDCFKDLSTPQQFLLLNSVFFAASPFHPDPNLRDGGIHYQVFIN
ncbi:3012_t:CDS:2 [Entrophospora sp. SA101]|nr:3012_t:CDS:2 [Entrophospora sp. SA101]CAJ0831387.1 12575_t:CDS:2 [Entrophospora sp. SA101]